MKKAAVIFAILFIATLLIPMISIFREDEEEKSKEMVTIFSSEIIFNPNYR